MRILLAVLFSCILYESATAQPGRQVRLPNVYVDNIYVGKTTDRALVPEMNVPTKAAAIAVATGSVAFWINVAADTDGKPSLYRYNPTTSTAPNKLDRLFYDTDSQTSGLTGPITVNNYTEAVALANGQYPKTIRVLNDANNGNKARTYDYWPDSIAANKLEIRN